MSASSRRARAPQGALSQRDPEVAEGGPVAVRRIGLDFDNTLAGYDHVFRSLARNEGVLPAGFSGGKREVRGIVTGLPDGERRWMRMQGAAYGRCMPAAELLPGVLDFLERCSLSGIEVFVVSHKTRHGHFDEERVDLRQAALAWMRAQGLFQRGLSESRVGFESTREAKVQRIRELELDVFVDDLLPVLTHAAFPMATRRLHLCGGARETGPPELPVEACPDWSSVSEAIFGTRPAHANDSLEPGSGGPWEDWLGEPLIGIERIGGGGNNQLYRVETRSRVTCLKRYLRDARDPRDRFGAEFRALEFLAAHGVREVPRLLEASEADQVLYLEWIDGAPIETPDSEDVGAALRFVERLHALSRREDARQLPLASEACLSLGELRRQVRDRFDRLAAVACLEPELATLLRVDLYPALAREEARALAAFRSAGCDPALELNPSQRTLSPSDFGFHNALRRSSGDLVFLDLEYFGQDDPVKLVADFVLHPRHAPFPGPMAEFLRAASALFDGDPFYRMRLGAQFGLYALRWCGIVLNAFLPERRARLTWAGASERRTLDGQLEQARRCLGLLHSSPNPADEI